MNPVLAAVAAALVLVLGAIGILAGEGEESEPAAEPARAPSLEQVTRRVEEIARGVERARELEFERVPRVRIVSPAGARRAGLAELDRFMPVRVQRMQERLLTMLGLLPADARLRDIVGTALASEVAGYYLPRTDTLALVRGEEVEGFLGEVALAHELGHALEDQHFGIDPHGSSSFLRDRGVAESALHEGSATLVMVDYVVVSRTGNRVAPEQIRDEVLGQLEKIALPESSGLPRYVRESLVFPYAAGARFVDRIQRAGGWEAVDRAFGDESPLSSEQVMHPRKYEIGERPAPVRLRGVRAQLPDGARVVARGDIGEFDTAQFLLDANGRSRADEAAAGWGGSTFELWRLPGGEDLLAVGWAWDSPADAAQFVRAARRSLARLPDAGAANGGNEGVTVVVLAPDPALARRVARAVAP
jgi:hypothetical protein